MLPSILPHTDDSDRFSAPIEIPDESPSPEAIRIAHINAEASIKAIGQLVLLGVVLGAMHLFFSLGAGDTGSMGALGLAFSIASLVAAAFAGAWLCAFDPRGRLLYTLLSLVQLVWAPFEWQAARELHTGTGVSPTAAALVWSFVHLLFLYVLWNRKGRMVMSRHYRETIIPATPRVEYRSRLPLLIGLGVLLMIILVAVAIALA